MVQVSVILPTFNRSASLVAAAASVLSQSFRDLELIIVDDASSEDIETVVRGLGDTRVRYVRRKSNGGAAAARNTGLEQALGTFIAFQDSDDVWLPGKLQTQMDKLRNLPRDVGAVAGARVVYLQDRFAKVGTGKVFISPPVKGRLQLDENQPRRLLTQNRLSLQNALFRRDCFPTRNWFDTRARASEDWDFAIRLAQHCRICEDGEVVTLSIVSADSISNDYRRLAGGNLRILRNNRRLFEQHPSDHASLLAATALLLWKTGRRRSSLKLARSAMAKSPTGLGFVARIVFRKLSSTLSRALFPSAQNMRVEFD